MNTTKQTFSIQFLSIIGSLAMLWACQSSPPMEEKSKANAISLQFESIDNPAIENSGMPNLFTSKTGTTYLSWIERPNDSLAVLKYATWETEKENWSETNTIAEGTDWFVNWADFPSLVATSDNHLVAHWLQKSATGTYDYDVKIAQSLDGGKTWNPSFTPHTDGIAAEHGFVSMMLVDDNQIFATWLDGRNTKGHGHETESHDEHGHGHGGAMTLRTATFNAAGVLSKEAELDNRVCDCCQTDAVMTAQGEVVVYRDRLEEEIRDISIVRKVNDEWTAPQRVAEDNWKIGGCPVNGPVAVANDEKLAVAWFTMQGEQPQVKVAFSDDSGENFDKAIQIDDGDPLGRVAMEWLNQDAVLVIWMEQLEKIAQLQAAIVSPKGKQGESFVTAEVSPKRSSGFPVITSKKDGTFLVAWTKVGETLDVETGILKFKR